MIWIFVKFLLLLHKLFSAIRCLLRIQQLHKYVHGFHPWCYGSTTLSIAAYVHYTTALCKLGRFYVCQQGMVLVLPECHLSLCCLNQPFALSCDQSGFCSNTSASFTAFVFATIYVGCYRNSSIQNN